MQRAEARDRELGPYLYLVLHRVCGYNFLSAEKQKAVGSKQTADETF